MTVGSGGCSIPGQENILDTNVTVTNPTTTPYGISYWISFNCTLSGTTYGSEAYPFSYITYNENRTKVINSNIIEMHIQYCCELATVEDALRLYPTSTLTYVGKVLPTLSNANSYKAKFELFGGDGGTRAFSATPPLTTPLEIELTGSISSGIMNIDTADAITKIKNLIATHYNFLQPYVLCYLVLKELVTN